MGCSFVAARINRLRGEAFARWPRQILKPSLFQLALGVFGAVGVREVHSAAAVVADDRCFAPVAVVHLDPAFRLGIGVELLDRTRQHQGVELDRVEGGEGGRLNIPKIR